MKLETMRPNPAWSPAGYEEAVDALAALPEDAVIKVWGGDWCPDCRSQLPDFAAALRAAGIDDDRIVAHPVEKLADGSKTGPEVEAYGIELIPTVVIETADGAELARFVEDAPAPIAVHLAEQLTGEELEA
jgi:thiol-disulfide isomerase/thioredoxin